MNKFLKWYIKGSSIFIIFLLFILITGGPPLILARHSSLTVNWIYAFLLAISPIGSIIGYIVWFSLGLFFSLIGSMLGFEKKEKEVSTPKQSGNFCPYAGTIYTEKEGTFLGFSWPTNTPMFYIEDDWKVYFSDEKIFGWIDRQGNIHKDSMMGDVNLDATLSGTIIGQIISNTLYINNENVGKLASY